MKTTRRSKSWRPDDLKNPVDTGIAKSVGYTRGESTSSDKANQEGIKIDADVWSEFITVGKFLCMWQDDPDIYDLFDWIRINIYSGQPYSDATISRADAEISRELGPWTKN